MKYPPRVAWLCSVLLLSLMAVKPHAPAVDQVGRPLVVLCLLAILAVSTLAIINERKNSVKFFTLSALALILVAVPSRAGDCVAPIVQKVQVQKYVAPVVQTYVAPVQQYVAPYVPTIAIQPVLLPIYSAVYQPLTQEQKDNQELIAEIRTLRSEFKALQALQAPPVQQQREPYPSPYPDREPLREQRQREPAPIRESIQAPPEKLSLSTKCAGCHSHSASTSRGGGFRMFDQDGRMSLTEEQKLEAIGSIASGTMPKGKSLTSSEKRQVMSLLK